MTDKILEQKMHFHPYQINAAYINALVDLVNACRLEGVELNEVKTFQGGWHITFKGHDGADAICHDHSYDSPHYGDFSDTKPNDWTMTNAAWETIGFPWDDDDVSVHSAEELAHFLAQLNRGESGDWA